MLRIIQVHLNKVFKIYYLIDVRSVYALLTSFFYVRHFKTSTSRTRVFLIQVVDVDVSSDLKIQITCAEFFLH